MNQFEVKAYPEMWKSLGMNVERFEKMRCVMGDAYQKTYLTQENRPAGMDYFDNLVAEIHGGRIAEILEAKKQGRPVVGTLNKLEIAVLAPDEPDIVGALGAALYARETGKAEI